MIWLFACCLGLALQAADPGIEPRRKIRQAIENPATAQTAAETALTDADPAIRLYGLYHYTRIHGEKALPKLFAMSMDKDPSVINFLTMFAASAQDREAGQALLLEIMNKNPNHTLRRMAARYASTFKFHKVTKRRKFDPQWDYELRPVQTIDLPLTGWRFTTDPLVNGHENGFYEISFDDSAWKLLKIGGWNKQGFPDYTGIAWYRITFTLPEKIDSKAVELYFRGVDECAWVWLNGVYCGQHDEGAAGWNRPFYLDVTEEIKWNAANTLVVRVDNSTMDGGIWKPVSIEILK
jgi:hypothetical protein